MIYLSYNFEILPLELGREILIAELGEAGFESFTETEVGVIAYIKKDEWNETLLNDIQILESSAFKISYTKEEIAQVNWNIEWEKNFNPIIIDEKVSIRAPFHAKPENVEYDLIIEPKMSFGTGHHQTTHVMVQHLNDLNLTDKKVLDMGCGTGILAIFAEKKGANFIDAIDNDAWCYENSVENVERNNCHHINVYEGDAALLCDKIYDVIIANINRNILLQDIKTYSASLKKEGVLLLSGFYVEDRPAIEAEAKKYQLKKVNYKERDNWVGVKFIKF
ncbi:MAG: 50S ribosomal protein L11 methyltransferase [Flavobacteriales bacterium CG_4_8_14_3_um_filter_35_10]|nr:MAG: 50S ribosomal protein L11 methyltransferase [Flavobacteriales bacterium CG_4_8_14_3_um_filter_35_10]PJA06395.1 MAG: 50S ribosomal protein L11 methyltransferase [Flavobacteriales bacterium CG_4_10_14_0_2_um_filter_35_18]